MYAQQLEIHDIIIVRVLLRVYNVWVFPEHQGVFLADEGWPPASQVCCDTYRYLEREAVLQKTVLNMSAK